jgi:6-pyruvoyltetrahydropterin/6-carboxytetrahydropterin synthase
MSLNGEGEYCNPTVENIVREIFLGVSILFEDTKYGKLGLKLHKIKLYETPNCFTVCKESSIPDQQYTNFRNKNLVDIVNYREEKGIVNYDDRN